METVPISRNRFFRMRDADHVGMAAQTELVDPESVGECDRYLAILSEILADEPQDPGFVRQQIDRILDQRLRLTG